MSHTPSLLNSIFRSTSLSCWPNPSQPALGFSTNLPSMGRSLPSNPINGWCHMPLFFLRQHRLTQPNPSLAKSHPNNPSKCLSNYHLSQRSNHSSNPRHNLSLFLPSFQHKRPPNRLLQPRTIPLLNLSLISHHSTRLNNRLNPFRTNPHPSSTHKLRSSRHSTLLRHKSW